MTEEAEKRLAPVAGGADMTASRTAPILVAAASSVALAKQAETGPKDPPRDVDPRLIDRRPIDRHADMAPAPHIKTLPESVESAGGGLDIIVNIASAYGEKAIQTDRDSAPRSAAMET